METKHISYQNKERDVCRVPHKHHSYNVWLKLVEVIQLRLKNKKFTDNGQTVMAIAQPDFQLSELKTKKIKCKC